MSFISHFEGAAAEDGSVDLSLNTGLGWDRGIKKLANQAGLELVHQQPFDASIFREYHPLRGYGDEPQLPFLQSPCQCFKENTKNTYPKAPDNYDFIKELGVKHLAPFTPSLLERGGGGSVGYWINHAQDDAEYIPKDQQQTKLDYILANFLLSDGKMDGSTPWTTGTPELYKKILEGAADMISEDGFVDLNLNTGKGWEWGRDMEKTANEAGLILVHQQPFDADARIFKGYLPLRGYGEDPDKEFPNKVRMFQRQEKSVK